MTRLHLLAIMFAVAALLLTVFVSETQYFPKGTESWYPKHLAAMKEPSLFLASDNQTVEQYRFLWLRSFDKPLAVRIWKDRAGITLRVVRLSGAGGYDPGHIEHEETFGLVTAQWDEFSNLLRKASFWDLSSSEKEVIGLDGSQWILEGQASGKYHVVDRWSPVPGGDKRQLESFVACCRYLLTLSKQEVPKKEDY